MKCMVGHEPVAACVLEYSVLRVHGFSVAVRRGEPCLLTPCAPGYSFGRLYSLSPDLFAVCSVARLLSPRRVSGGTWSSFAALCTTFGRLACHKLTQFEGGHLIAAFTAGGACCMRSVY